MFDVDIFAPSQVGSTALNFTLLDCLQICTRRMTSISGFFSFSFSVFAPASQESNELTNHTEKKRKEKKRIEAEEKDYYLTSNLFYEYTK